MILLPAIDLYEKKVVRLTRGDYAQMTVYNDDPVAQAKLFQEAGAQWLHTVDLEGAKDGSTPNYSVIEAICKDTSLKVEIGGGIRSLDTIQKYLDAGVERVILGTVICTDVSKDGMLAGTNVDLYRQLSQKFSLDLIASGGVSSQEDLTRLKELGLYGAILGKALYTGALDLKAALREMEG